MTAYNPYLCIQQRRCTEDQTMSNPDDPPPPRPDRPLLPLWWALDFALLPLPTRFSWIPPLQVIVIAIASIDDTRERHTVSFACTFGECSTWWYILDSLANKRLPVKSTPLFGTMELDQGEANVCIWQDTNKATEVPFKKYSGLKHGRRENKRKEIKSITISTPSLGSKWRKKIYCILL